MQSDIIDHISTLGAPSVQVNSPFATLVKCEGHIFSCVSEVNDITFNLKHTEQISLDLLTEPLVYGMCPTRPFSLCQHQLRMTLS